ncbi:transcriptional regulator [Baekduia alba]|uniref:PadR family transcriptional regulator n=1 Tax=Baekduia alba TaxID=2997333 RepID=UPI00234005D0|nr:PadR family transcriptional regulator [Baekduia alba]WCB94640.1 transcriptional regulator [Baekduia alba]
MSLRHAMLGLLAVEPATGYDLTRKFDKSISNAWHASHSQIYPELAKLEDAGMVEVVSEGARRSKTWALTDAGREELRRWLVEVEPSRQQRNESALRTFLAPRLLAPEDARIALQRDLDYVLEQRVVLLAIKQAIEEGGISSPFEPAVDLGLRISPVMEGWLRDQLAALPRSSRTKS